MASKCIYLFLENKVKIMQCVERGNSTKIDIMNEFKISKSTPSINLASPIWEREEGETIIKDAVHLIKFNSANEILF